MNIELIKKWLNTSGVLETLERNLLVRLNYGANQWAKKDAEFVAQRKVEIESEINKLNAEKENLDK